MNHAQAMDDMYRYQRYIYDFTRKYFLLGRDSLLARMEIAPHQQVLELGCGTAHNLVRLAKQHPQTHFYGIDASAQMLISAEKKVRAWGNPVVLKQGLAEDLNFKTTFGLNQPFDVIFFSYALSMIPPWREAFEVALANLKIGGRIYIVDFFDQAELPVFFQKALTHWLDYFQVHYRPELISYLHELVHNQRGTLNIIPLYKRYTFIAEFKKIA